MLPRICLSMQRFLLPAWVGAAVLFVVTSVAEQQFEGFASTIKNQLALIRFPLYYAFGFIMLLTSLGCGTARMVKGERSKATVTVFALLLIANVLMIVDFLFIYQPLANIMVDVLRPRDDEFTKYHQMSKYINAVNVFLSAIAAIIVCREPRGQIEGESK
jgi:glucan phosphoethanolaminetransferase (alkaline phosphatase superfamily)